MKILLSCLMLCSFVGADINPKFIGEHYAEGVVKIILYDSELVEDFDLEDDEGQLGRGSGFFVTPEGVIFTNRHVIEWCVTGYMIVDWVDESGKLHEIDILNYDEEASKDPHIKKIYYAGHATPIIQVFDAQGEDDFHLYRAEVLQMGETFDGAILKIVSDLDGKPLNTSFTALPLGDSNQMSLGESLIVLGFPTQYAESDLSMDLKDTLTLSRGTNSGWDFVFDEVYGMFKTDASIHEGNSGGPVFGDDNKVIGIATSMGLQTSIGLVGPINVMYWIAKPVSNVFDALVKRGLMEPKRGSSAKTISGKPVPITIDKAKFMNPVAHKQVKY